MPKSAEQKTKDQLKELADLKKEALDAIKKYNQKANKYNADSRIGLASTSIYIEDHLYDYVENKAEELDKEYDELTAEEREKFEAEFYEENDINDLASNRDYCGGSISYPGTNGYWFPSSIC